MILSLPESPERGNCRHNDGTYNKLQWPVIISPTDENSKITRWEVMTHATADFLQNGPGI